MQPSGRCAFYDRGHCKFGSTYKNAHYDDLPLSSFVTPQSTFAYHPPPSFVPSPQDAFSFRPPPSFVPPPQGASFFRPFTPDPSYEQPHAQRGALTKPFFPQAQDTQTLEQPNPTADPLSRRQRLKQEGEKAAAFLQKNVAYTPDELHVDKKKKDPNDETFTAPKTSRARAYEDAVVDGLLEFCTMGLNRYNVYRRDVSSGLIQPVTGIDYMGYMKNDIELENIFRGNALVRKNLLLAKDSEVFFEVTSSSGPNICKVQAGEVYSKLERKVIAYKALFRVWFVDEAKKALVFVFNGADAQEVQEHADSLCEKYQLGVPIRCVHMSAQRAFGWKDRLRIKQMELEIQALKEALKMLPEKSA